MSVDDETIQSTPEATVANAIGMHRCKTHEHGLVTQHSVQRALRFSVEPHVLQRKSFIGIREIDI